MGHWAVVSIVVFRRMTMDFSWISTPSTGSLNETAGFEESHATYGAVRHMTAPSASRRATDVPSVLAFRLVDNAVITPVSPLSFTSIGGVVHENSIVSLIRSGMNSYFAPGTFAWVKDPSLVIAVTSPDASVSLYGQLPLLRSICDMSNQEPSHRRN